MLTGEYGGHSVDECDKQDAKQDEAEVGQDFSAIVANVVVDGTD